MLKRKGNAAVGQACAKGRFVFVAEWRFVGIAALGPIAVAETSPFLSVPVVLLPIQVFFSFVVFRPFPILN